MAKLNGSLLASLVMAGSLAACNQNAVSEPRESEIDAPSVAHDREDIELIIRAYLLEHPEVIAEAMDILKERENEKITAELASDKRDPSYGPDDAPVTIVEFFDYNCGYCKRSVDWVIKQVDEGDGNVRVVFKELPILSEESRTAALASLAAQKQGKYMEFHQLLMHQPAHTLTDERIDELAESIGINLTRMHKDMEKADTLDHIQDIREQAIKFGATATPSFVVNGELIQGYDVAALEDRIDQVLSQVK